MIVGIATLVSLLLFGGDQQYFFVENLEKGVKEYVVDKDRSKEILTLLKYIKGTTKDFNKGRKKRLKEFQKMNIDYQLTREDFYEFFEDLTEDRLEYQKSIIDLRINAVDKIEQGEWAHIIEQSNGILDEKLGKATKKSKKKENDAFTELEATIQASISDSDRLAEALNSFQELKDNFTNFEKTFESINTKENDILINKETDTSAAKEISVQLNELRKKARTAIIDFRFEIQDVASEENWRKIMKSLNKLVQ